MKRGNFPSTPLNGIKRLRQVNYDEEAREKAERGEVSEELHSEAV